jgi:hypothetical protein
VARGKPALTVAGRWFWDDYRLAAAVRPVGKSVVGLIVNWQDAQNYLLFRWLPEDHDHARGREKQLWRVWRGQQMLLATAPGGYRAKQWYQLSVSAVNGVVTAAIDGHDVLQKRTDLFGQGKVGLYASGEEPVLVDDVTVEHTTSFERAKTERREAITPQFTKEESMQNWASPKAEWLPTTVAERTTLWNRGTFFGDHAVEVKATALQPGRSRVTAAICGDGNSLESGYTLLVTQREDKRLESTLLRRGKAVTKPVVAKTVADANFALRLARAGKTVRAYIGSEMVASYVDAEPLGGRRAAYEVKDAQIDFSDARVTGGNLYDYTFYRAPTDWYVSGGTWDMTSRWDCSPGWSWYGGWSDRVAAIWNKHSFAGDFVVDMFAACKRDGGYQHPRDINMTIAGDGRDLASGYSLIFGGWNNTSTRIMRGTQAVAETSKVLLPKDYQNQAHHKWFNLRVEKTGNTISYYVDRELALRYQDPNPLSGRRIALWTCGNGVIIARATIYYQQELPNEPVPPLIENHNFNAVAAEKVGWKVRDKEALLQLDAVKVVATTARPQPGAKVKAPVAAMPVPAVRAVNLDGGGSFALTPEIESFDVLKTPKLSFDVQLNRGTAINLYLRAKGTTHSVRLTGATREQEVESTKVLGVAPGVRADGQWHNVNLDLAALLKPLYPNDSEIRVEELFLGNLTRDTYRQAGFGANVPGASYLVRSFALRGADNRIAQRVEPQLKGAAPKIAAAPVVVPANQIKAEPVANTTPMEAVRGLLNLRATYCQDEDRGAFKQELLDQPIPWKAFSRPLFTNKITSIDFDWQDKAPTAGIRPTYWSARFFGKLLVPREGEYVFTLDRLDDGGRLYIDGELVIDSWRVQAATSRESKAIKLAPGAHDIRVDYSQGTGMGSLALRWKGPGFDKEIIPAVTAAAETPAATLLGAR